MCLATIAMGAPVAAQSVKSGFATGRTSLGLNVGSSDYLYARSMLGERWGAEVGVLESNRWTPGNRNRTQGLNISMVGRAPISQSLGVYGRVGTIYGLGGSGGLGMRSEGFGLSFGAGLSWDFTPRLSATLAWDTHDLRLASGGREPVRSTSLGLQYRY
jgi:hypothetical protein